MEKAKKIITYLLYAVMCVLCVTKTVIAKNTSDSSYVVTLYNEQTGLPTGEANTVLQTSDGYIWIGSYGGLIRYDGTSFRNYSVERAIQSSSIRALFEDSQGRLWIGTNDAGVIMMEDDEFTDIISPEDRSFACIRDFTEGEDGTIYIASNSGMGEIRDGKIVPYTDEALKGNTVYTIAVDGRGRVWGGMSNGNCVVFRDGELVNVVTSRAVFDNADIYSLDENAEGSIVFGSSEDQVAVVSFPSDSLKKQDLQVTHYDTGNVRMHNAINATENGYILVSGIDGFAVIDSNGEVREFGKEENVSSVNAAIADHENNIWLASSNFGVMRYSQGCFSTPNAVAELEGIAINSIEFCDGCWYIAHDTGLIICDEKWNQISNELTDMYEGVRIRSIVVDSKGTVWLASYSDFALVNYNPASETIKEYGIGSGLVSDKARVVYEMSDGRIVLGTQAGVNVIENGKVTESYVHEDGIDNPSILCVSEGENGEIILGSDGDGIYIVSEDKVEHFGFEEGLNDGVVLRMLKDSEKDAWFVSAGSSLYYWEGRTVRNLTNFEKDAGSVFDMIEMDEKLWIVQNSGLIAIDKKQLLSGENTDTIHYGIGHGLTGSIDANVWNYLSEDGMLYVATRNGISVFGFEGVNNGLPKVLVHSANVDGTVYEHPKQLDISRGAKRVTIDFGALSYSDATELRIAYRLKGFDEETFIMAEKNGSVSYTNLPGGTYEFEMQIYSPEQPEEKVTYMMQVVKEQKMSESIWFWLVLVFLVILICTGIVWVYAKMKMKALHRRQQEYKDIVEQSLRTFAKTIDAKDSYTQGHSIRVAEYSRELAKRMGMSEEEQERIYYIALMHDIGKIGVPDYILNKPGRLTDEEMETIRKHVDIGGDILKDFTALDGIAQGAKFHHERYDGKGYTEGLAGEEIPQVARIIGVADSYDAMASDRCYRKALSNDIIVDELNKYKGTQFDPEVVSHMLAMIEEGAVPMKEEE